MSAEVRPRTNSESMTLALVLALGLHALIITQLQFGWMSLRPASVPTSLDVILVDWAAEKPPEEVDFLAQAAQIGGGETPERERPSAPPEPVHQPIPVPEEPAADFSEVTEPEAEGELITVADPEAEPLAPESAEPAVPQVADARQLMRQTRSIARTAPDSLDDYRPAPERPRRKFVSANTREHLYAAYMRSWVAKVERVGNMNYPEQARRQNMEGSLVLSVDVLADGSIENIRVLRSSGYELLDEAAVRIVRLAAPYAELPPEIRREADVLTITRTWQFSARRGLR